MYRRMPGIRGEGREVAALLGAATWVTWAVLCFAQPMLLTTLLAGMLKDSMPASG